jgi:hypothetical protein
MGCGVMDYHLRDLDADWWAQVKAKAAAEKISLKALIESRLKAWLAGQK